MTLDEVAESERMIEAIERELVEEIKSKYCEIESIMQRVSSRIERMDEDLAGKVEAVYREVEREALARHGGLEGP